MAKIGYARVDIRTRNGGSQVAELEAYGCDRLFTDHGVPGKLARRPGLDAALACMREGDTLVITRLSRAMRSLPHLLELAGTLRERGIDLVVLQQGIDTTASHGRLVFHVLGTVGEARRELIAEGTREGLQAAKAKGSPGGRPRALSEEQARLAVREHGAKRATVTELAQMFGCSTRAVYSAIERQRKATAS